MTLTLDSRDEAMLAGDHGDAVALAMRVITRVAASMQAESLLDISGAHIDSCLYHGQAGLDFALRLADDGATVWWAVCLAVFGRWRRLCRDKCFESLHKRLSVFAGSVLRRCERSVRGEYMRRNWIHSISHLLQPEHPSRATLLLHQNASSELTPLALPKLAVLKAAASREIQVRR